MNVEETIKTEKKIPLKSRTIIHFTLIHNQINESITKALKPFDVSLQQFNVLRILKGQNSKPANLSTINERMVTKMSNTTRLVDKLLLKEFVKRKTCSANRRKIEITITNKGEKVLEKMNFEILKTQNEILKNFTDKELEQLNILFNKF